MLRSVVNMYTVAPHADDPLVSKFHKPDVFPGSMSMQMGRRHLPLLRDHDYWITEKSDGIRVMMLVLRVKDFPRWHWRSSGGDSGRRGQQAERSFSLWNQCVLEEAWARVMGRMREAGALGSGTDSELITLQHQERQDPQQQEWLARTADRSGSRSGDGDGAVSYTQYRMVVRQQQQGVYAVSLRRVHSDGDDDNHNNNNNINNNNNNIGGSGGGGGSNDDGGDELPIYRGRGRSFAYVFDRNYEFYLCTDEYCFPTQAMKAQYRRHPERPLTFQDVLLVDGEIVYNLLERRYNYSLYDIAVFCFTGGGGSSSSSSSSGGSGSSTGSIPCSCAKRRMSERIKYIRDHVVCSIGSTHAHVLTIKSLPIIKRALY